MASGSGRRGGLRLARILSGNVNSYLSSGAEKASTAAWRSTGQLYSAEIAPFGARSVSGHIPFTALLGGAPASKLEKKLIVTISSDKGLCGGMNSTVVKYSRALVRLNALDHGPDDKPDVVYVVVGEKGEAQLQRGSKKLISMYFGETQKQSICFTQCSMMADDILKSNEYDAIQMVYNKFNSVVSFLPTVATLLSPQQLLAGTRKSLES
ncbi:unnamed protein product [Sphagnum tenellum]